jgi:hypothetical protein
MKLRRSLVGLEAGKLPAAIRILVAVLNVGGLVERASSGIRACTPEALSGGLRA